MYIGIVLCAAMIFKKRLQVRAKNAPIHILIGRKSNFRRNFMSIITQLERYSGYSETTLNGVLESAATYEVVDNVLIIRTTTHDTIHITKEIGKKLINLLRTFLKFV